VDAYLIRAAGGVVWRRVSSTDEPEVVLVHRPRFDDWTLPKGKLKRGEHPLRGAVREVWEETGVRCAVGARLPTVRYEVWAHDALADKVVDYWTMSVLADDGFAPGSEVDQRSWLAVGEALKRVSYPHDKRVLTAFAELPAIGAPVLLLRHATAGSRRRWTGPDGERPLDSLGQATAARLGDVVPSLAPRRLISASPRRCVQTLEPLAAALQLSIEVDPTFDEDADPGAAAKELRRLADGPTVVCSQGGLIAPALARIPGSGATPHETDKGAGWVLSFAAKGLAALDEFTL
jgi:8-oxo-dGTP pyrophosphatase MutT (NUDIX family)